MERNGAKPFLTKTYEIVDDPSTDFAVSWSAGNNSFLVKDPHYFSLHLLPRYFKHSNISSFVRQLNTYGFRKIDADRWEFAHESFLRGQKQLLNTIRRRRSHKGVALAGTSSHDLGIKYDLEGEFDEDAIVGEVVQLKKEQENIDREMEDMKRRLDLTEYKPQQMISFLATVIDNPALITKLQNRASVSGGKKRRRLPHKNQEENLPELGLDSLSTNALNANGFTDSGLSRNGLIADGFEYSPTDMPHIDSQTRAGLLSEELMATCSLMGKNSENCIEKPEFEIHVDFEKDDVDQSEVESMLCWDEVFTDAPLTDYKVLSEMAHIAISPDSK